MKPISESFSLDEATKHNKSPNTNNTFKHENIKKNRHEIIKAEVSKNYGRSDQNRPKCR